MFMHLPPLMEQHNVLYVTPQWDGGVQPVVAYVRDPYRRSLYEALTGSYNALVKDLNELIR